MSSNWDPMSRTILVVEDDHDMRATLAAVLQAEGFVVVQAGNGHDALLMLRQGLRPCLILLDLMMPLMNGWQFIVERTKDSELANLPVVVMSANAIGGLPVPAADFLAKPMRLQALLAVVAKKCSVH